MIEEDKDYPLEDYLNQEEEFNDFKDANKDYKDNSIFSLTGLRNCGISKHLFSSSTTSYSWTIHLTDL